MTTFFIPLGSPVAKKLVHTWIQQLTALGNSTLWFLLSPLSWYVGAAVESNNTTFYLFMFYLLIYLL